MARELAFSAISARLEARLHPREVRHRPAETAIPAENIAQPAARFVLPSRGTPTIFVPTPPVTETAANPSSAPSSDLMVGATFRRKGMLSDIPMPVTRVDAGKVYTSFSDGETSQELAFDPSELELVSRAPVEKLPAEIELFPNLAELVRSAPPITLAGSGPDSAMVEIATPVITAPAIAPVPEYTAPLAPVDSSVTVQFAAPADTASVPDSVSVDAPTTAPTTADTSAKTASAALPPGAVRLADGTVQFGYAPTGGVINLVPNKPEPTPAEFGIGATVRRHGVLSDEPLTVTKVGDGLLTATRATSTGILTYEFPFNQFDLVTAAPGS